MTLVGWPAIQIVPRHPTPLFIVVMATLSASGIQVMHRIDYVGVMKYTRLYSLTVTYACIIIALFSWPTKYGDFSSVA